VLCGAHLAGVSATQLARLRTYADCVGLVYQIMDDVFDATAPAEELGKTPGKDAAAGKATYAVLAGVDASVALADRLLATAKAQLSCFEPAAAAPLLALADYVRRVGTKSPLRGGETGAGDLVFYPTAPQTGDAPAAPAPKPSCR
jgi:geranylgeranyl diphosphate synthase type II